ncbi:LysR family transcriptional regulator [Priestia megaterium]|uniref:LysR family transcriptional regulator n=1 Tax=Priestia megaterium TaxID=1404 RepID=UPI003A810D3F
MVDFEWYRSFVHIYKYNSLSEAAKSRFMTQPAMSQHLSYLEAEVGESLFIRNSRKMKPTEKGKELYTQVAPLVESLEKTSINFKTLSSSTSPTLRIGSAQEFFKERILPHLEELNMRVIAQYGIASYIINLLKEDKLDVVISSKKYHIPGIEYNKLWEEKFVLVTHPALELPKLTNLNDLEGWLSSQNWISYGLELPIIRRFWREHFKKRPQISPAHILPDLHMILKAVEKGEGISFLPTYMLKESLDSRKTKIALGEYFVTNQLYIAYQLKDKSELFIKDLINIINK